MTPEERFTKIENSLSAMTEQHPQHDEDIRQIRETQKATEAVILKTARVLLKLAEAQKATDEMLKNLAANVDRMMRGPGENPA